MIACFGAYSAGGRFDGFKQDGFVVEASGVRSTGRLVL